MKYLYKITNNINGKVYIGQTIDYKKRWTAHCTVKEGKDSLITKAIQKYGQDNFDFKVLAILEDHMIDEAEIKAIEIYKSVVPEGYNISLGGGGFKRNAWNSEWDKLLGTKPDVILAEELGTSAATLGNRRLGAGIPAYNPVNKLDYSLLGTMSDVDIAKKCGLSNSTVSYIRREEGIPAYEKDTPNFQREIDIPLEDYDRYSDYRLSLIYGGDHHMIRTRRKALGIDPHNKRINDVDYSVIDISLLGLLPDSEVGLIYDLSAETIKRYRKSLDIPSFTENNKVIIDNNLLGTMADTELAKKYNCNSGLITKRRNKLGIPAFKLEKGVKLPKIEMKKEHLETMTILELSRLYNCSPTTASTRRKEAGILSVTEKKKRGINLDLLDTCTDKELVKIWGISLQTVRKYRKRQQGEGKCQDN